LWIGQRKVKSQTPRRLGRQSQIEVRRNGTATVVFARSARCTLSALQRQPTILLIRPTNNLLFDARRGEASCTMRGRERAYVGPTERLRAERFTNGRSSSTRMPAAANAKPQFFAVLQASPQTNTSVQYRIIYALRSRVAIAVHRGKLLVTLPTGPVTVAADTAIRIGLTDNNGIASFKSKPATFSGAENQAFAAELGAWFKLASHVTGDGSVASKPAGITCGSDCSEEYARGTGVTLTAAPDGGSVFTGWSGACTGAQATCTVTMDAAKTVTAKFARLLGLTVTRAGSGSGTVTSSPPGINCGADCSESYAQGTAVTLTAAPDNASAFSGWSGACTGAQATCTVTMDAAKTVTATFARLVGLTVTRAGSGSGTVTSSPPGINCGADCSESYAQGTAVTLTATADASSVFSGWSGACTGAQATCTVTMDAAKTVTATFGSVVQTSTLMVTKAGSGNGTVTSSPPGINCGTDCTKAFPTGTAVTLTAAPDNASTFSGWSGACTGTQTTCQLTMDAAKTVVATFTPAVTTWLLTVTKAGSGTGTVTSSPPGINCGADCNESYAQGTLVTLTAMADASSVFSGWSGACSGAQSTCQVTMDSAKSVTATFTHTFLLTVINNGCCGTVTSSPGGINCGSDCSERYAADSVVTLTAKPDPGAFFFQWSGACTGTQLTCNVTMNGDKSVTATFTHLARTSPDP
jgi:uncharacterized repeat protein (TIGR02543 family)